jgi:hypothetical protein
MNARLLRVLEGFVIKLPCRPLLNKQVTIDPSGNRCPVQEGSVDSCRHSVLSLA